MFLKKLFKNRMMIFFVNHWFYKKFQPPFLKNFEELNTTSDSLSYNRNALEHTNPHFLTNVNKAGLSKYYFKPTCLITLKLGLKAEYQKSNCTTSVLLNIQ